MNKFKLLAISSLITIPLTGCDSSDDETAQIFTEEQANIDYYGPVITLIGDDLIEIAVDGTYTELGATAVDYVDGDVSSNIVIDSSSINTAKPGNYKVTYTVSDAVGNESVYERTIFVPDTIIPELSLLGDEEITRPIGATYNDAGVTAVDSTDGDITSDVVVTISFDGDASVTEFDKNTVGTYTFTYNVVDDAENAALPVTRTVIVADIPDTEAPVITASTHVDLKLGETFALQATSLDDIDGDISDQITFDSSAIDINTIGSYTITYTSSDSSSNTATLNQTVHIIPSVDGIDAFVDVTPSQTGSPITLGGSLDGATEQMFSSAGGANTTKIVDSMFNNYNMSIVQVPIYATLSVDHAYHDNVEKTIIRAKELGMDVIAVVSEQDGVFSNITTKLMGEDKYTAISKCSTPCTNIYNIDMSAYANYLDTLLSRFEAAGGKVDYLMPFSKDDGLTANDYEMLLSAMSNDDNDNVLIVGADSKNIENSSIEYANLATHLDVVTSTFQDEFTLHNYDARTEWVSLVNEATTNNTPVWLTENNWTSPVSNNIGVKAALGMNSILSAVNSGAKTVIVERQDTIFGWFAGSFPNTVRRYGLQNFKTAAINNNTVETNVIGGGIQSASFLNTTDNTLYVVISSINENSTNVAIRLQGGATVVAGTDVTATDDIYLAKKWGEGTSGGAVTTSISDDNTSIEVEMSKNIFVIVTIPLTETSD